MTLYRNLALAVLGASACLLLPACSPSQSASAPTPPPPSQHLPQQDQMFKAAPPGGTMGASGGTPAQPQMAMPPPR